ncbi:sulfatase family protein [Mucilaginibacter panaciglaebae]|uniref:Sulfatase N-terminal domain-containing protein n=1 Tax=Mucilaginibacter panaciglaebae TaxID=502331 RepID=A0ABP7WPV6_9SPHI
MKKIFVSAVLLAAAGFGLTAYTKKQAPKRPNVIVIYTDDQGYADLNLYGSKDLYTPNMDALAKSGVRFMNFYAAAPICSPSRASLLTGRYPQRAGLPAMAPSKEGGAGMPGSQYTMGELFKDAGYKTAHIGKWHVGYTKDTEPNAQGFDYSFGFMGGCIDNYSHFFYWDGPNRHDLWRNGTEIYEPGQFFADLMVDEAGKFMDENKNGPFFMYWAINNPHYPLQGKKKWLDYYKHLPSPRDKYAASISTMDENIGALLKKVDELGLRDNTIIVFQSDQGFSREERTFGGGGSAGQYRGSKFSLFEGGVRVPAFISWPKHIEANGVRNQVATNIDWYPTLAEYCGIKLPARKLDGVSLVPIIKSTQAKTEHQVFNWQSGGGRNNPQWSVLDGDWKLMHSPFEAKKDELNAQGYFLVNLKDDPSEQHNIAEQHPDVVKHLEEVHQKWIAEVFQQ